jgi:hypothetical protein
VWDDGSASPAHDDRAYPGGSFPLRHPADKRVEQRDRHDRVPNQDQQRSRRVEWDGAKALLSPRCSGRRWLGAAPKSSPTAHRSMGSSTPLAVPESNPPNPVSAKLEAAHHSSEPRPARTPRDGSICDSWAAVCRLRSVSDTGSNAAPPSHASVLRWPTDWAGSSQAITFLSKRESSCRHIQGGPRAQGHGCLRMSRS